MMGKVIVVSGSVGSGKTTLAKFLAKRLKAQYVDVKALLLQHPEVVAGYDQKRKSKEVDIQKLNKVLIALIKRAKKTLVIDSHLSHYLPAKYVDVCIICKCSLKELKRRLAKRNYSKEKVRENLDVEIFDVCLTEALELGHNVRVVETDRNVERQLQGLLNQDR